ncbi:MAG: hypothetical protein LBM08_00810 [Dysgonamonadaceae bacterium]|jgi:hypothetical protein|nr:hypothetical protein [Dysgonamonadaceae bacterium]
MITINVVKNVALKDITFKANNLVLVKQTRSVSKNGVETLTVRYCELCGLTDRKDVTIVKAFTKFLLGEYNLSKNLETAFKDTGIIQRKLLTPFLSEREIFATDENGTLSAVVQSEIPLKNTALTIRFGHTLTTVSNDNFRAALHRHAEAILKQCKYISLLGEQIKLLDAILDGKVKITKAAAQTKAA